MVEPATEEQALARIHRRLGQTRPCTCVRIVAKRTVEERILALQKAKSVLGQGALARPSAEQGRDAQLEDITRLFEPFEG